MAQMLVLWQFRTTSSSAWLLLLGKLLLNLPSLVSCRGADVVWMEGEPEISVSFNHSGKALQYRLSARDIFAKGAELVAHTDEGKQLLDALPVSTFVSRVENQWASVDCHEDGSLSGLFENRGEVLRLHATMQDKPIALGSFGSGFVRFVASSVLPSNGGAGVAGTVVSAASHLRNGTTQASDGGGARAELSVAASGGNVDQWWPGCYEGDSRTHVLSVGIVADKAAWDLYTEGLRSKIVAAVSQASFIYERQMNIRLEIAELTIFKGTEPGAPLYAGDCKEGSAMASTDFMQAKLVSLASSTRPLRGAWHLFTGCGSGHGTLGIALTGTMCTSKAVAVSQLQPDPLIAFAHELGHNLGAGHSFEMGRGKTGGIMDYGVHTVKGVLQFNTKYRRDEMCKFIQASQGRCGTQLRSSK
eukprot:CAMPEP_0177215672 /NCGR_PEP_ID=MMETSP0367-20130122/34347_1 /TAXON_ID=447022 ORGANISM="Scrippsiella hangoei-like, Strain SHHI-4" /NCGR_SAMPLE_ID=MMETSP0367 /ASSEMBLY_ACC=CAM_ASM_000362 /LENGTH=415 /DNA_ID=CAMNT_0018665133 /DNA_START=133 /DNA_END=1380 /DNA_ORIENTATION=-